MEQRNMDLTPRQIQVLQLMAEGHSEKTCGRILGLSYKTVQDHVVRARQRIGAANRTHAVAIGFRDGWLR